MRSAYQKAFTTLVFTTFFGMLLVVGVQQTASQFGRFDMTSSRKYTLSNVTREILQEDGKIKIEVFASNNLPATMQYQLNEIQYMLADYQSAGRGNIEVRYLNPQTNQARIQELRIQPTQFNTIGQDQYQVQQGYLAIAIMDEAESPDKTQVLDFLQDVDNLEYRLSYLINQIKRSEKPRVGYLTSAGERDLSQEYQVFNIILQENYTIERIELPTINAEDINIEDTSLADYNALFIVNPQIEYAAESMDAIRSYIDNGGNVLYIGDTIFINRETGEASPLGEFAGSLLQEYGAVVNTDLVYDTKSRISIPMGNIQMMYPMITISNLTTESGFLIENLPNIVMNPYTSSLTLDGNWTPIYVTSDGASTQTSNFNLDPQAVFDTNNLRELTVMAGIELESGAKLIIAGSSYLFEDQFVQNTQENVSLLFTLADYIADGRGLSEIGAKNLLGGQFLFVEDAQRFGINYFGPGISFTLLGLIGVTRLRRRAKLRKTFG